MYQYTEFDRHFVRQRAAQYRDQLERNLSGQLSDDDFRPLRLQNGWYVQRHAPMLRVAVPYGELSSAQLRVLAKIARDYDQPSQQVYDNAQEKQSLLGTAKLPTGYGHFTTRQNLQFNWIALADSADVMDLLASVDMHGIQTSGNCIRNITSDERAGIAADEIADPRPFAEIMRQWSTLHPEFAFLPRKFKIAITGAREDRAATAWHDVGLHVLRADDGSIGFKVMAGGGMGRTPIIASTLREFLPWNQILNYLEALVRVYNRWGRRDNMYKARIKILVKAEGQRFKDELEAEYKQIVTQDGAPHTIPQAELDRVAASFVPPSLTALEHPTLDAPSSQWSDADKLEYSRWLKQNVAPHKDPQLRAVTMGIFRVQPPSSTGSKASIPSQPCYQRMRPCEPRPWRCRRASTPASDRPRGRYCSKSCSTSPTTCATPSARPSPGSSAWHFAPPSRQPRGSSAKATASFPTSSPGPESSRKLHSMRWPLEWNARAIWSVTASA